MSVSKRTVRHIGHLNSLFFSFSNKYFLMQLKWNPCKHFVTEISSFWLKGTKSIGQDSLYIFIKEYFTGFKKQSQNALILFSFDKISFFSFIIVFVVFSFWDGGIIEICWLWAEVGLWLLSKFSFFSFFELLFFVYFFI